MTPEMLEVVGPFVAGPAAAVFIMLMVLAAVYKLIVSHFIPMMAAGLERHLVALDRLVDQNREDHIAMIAQIKDLERSVTNHGVRTHAS